MSHLLVEVFVSPGVDAINFVDCVTYRAAEDGQNRIILLQVSAAVILSTGSMVPPLTTVTSYQAIYLIVNLTQCTHT